MKWFRISGWLGIAVALAVLPACTGGGSRKDTPEGDRIKVGFVSNNEAEFWTIAEAGTRKAAEELGVEVLFRRPKQPTAAAQKEIIEDLMSRGAQAIAISVIDPINQKDYLNRIADRVPLITQDNDAPDTRRKCYIGTDNYQAGKAVGKLVKEVLPDGGTIAIFVGQPDPLNAQQRRQGVLDELEVGSSDKYRLLGTKYDNADSARAKANADDVLTQLQDDPKVCLIGLWAYNPPAILSAVKAARKEGKVHIVGFDEDENTLLGIKDGFIHGTVVQQPFEFGYQSVKLMTSLIKDPKTPLPANGVMHIPHLVIKKNNVDAFHDKLKEQKKGG